MNKSSYSKELITNQDGRVCNTCSLYKLWDEFSKGNSFFGYKSECKFCQGLNKRLYKEKNCLFSSNLYYQEDSQVSLQITGVKRNRTSYIIKSRKYQLSPRQENYSSRKEYMNAYHSFWEKNTESGRQNRRTKDLRRRMRGRGKRSSQPVKVIQQLEQYNRDHFYSTYFSCEYCKIIMINESYHLDHIKPISKDGGNNIENLAISCSGCNISKSARDLEDFSPNHLSYFEERNSKWKI